MERAEGKFAEVVKDWLDQAEITDLGEDFRFRNRQANELPDWVVNKVERMKKIREAKAALAERHPTKAETGACPVLIPALFSVGAVPERTGIITSLKARFLKSWSDGGDCGLRSMGG